LVVVGGAAATGTLFAPQAGTKLAGGIGFAVAVVGALQLVFAFGERAQEHRWLQKRVAEVLAKMYELSTQKDWNENEIPNLVRKLGKIYADEPPTMYALDAICYNSAHLALNNPADPNDLIAIRKRERITAQFLQWSGRQFFTEAEIARAKQAKVEAKLKANS